MWESGAEVLQPFAPVLSLHFRSSCCGKFKGPGRGGGGAPVPALWPFPLHVPPLDKLALSPGPGGQIRCSETLKLPCSDIALSGTLVQTKPKVQTPSVETQVVALLPSPGSGAARGAGVSSAEPGTPGLWLTN